MSQPQILHDLLLWGHLPILLNPYTSCNQWAQKGKEPLSMMFNCIVLRPKTMVSNLFFHSLPSKTTNLCVYISSLWDTTYSTTCTRPYTNHLRSLKKTPNTSKKNVELPKTRKWEGGYRHSTWMQRIQETWTSGPLLKTAKVTPWKFVHVRLTMWIPSLVCAIRLPHPNLLKFHTF